MHLLLTDISVQCQFQLFLSHVNQLAGFMFYLVTHMLLLQEGLPQPPAALHHMLLLPMVLLDLALHLLHLWLLVIMKGFLCQTCSMFVT